ncbi:MAG: response regulator [Treponema sp.]|jgi:signal transduction histidine kinase/DNA-binding response OmpR family regulator|nr:response regulator [Treponema sp.]
MSGIVVLISGASLVPGVFVNRQRIMGAIQDDLTASGQITSRLMEDNLHFIKRAAETAAIKMAVIHPEEDPDLVANEIAQVWGYLSMDIIEENGEVTHYGDNPLLIPTGESDYVKRAFLGESVVSTTELVPDYGVVGRVFVPMAGNRVLEAVLPGLLLSDLISGIQIWQSGSIFVIDDEGTIVASPLSERVLVRRNFIEMGKNDPARKSAGDFYQYILESEADSGLGKYVLDGEERYCAYTRIAGSDGWYVGVVAPVPESPLSDIVEVLLVSAAIVLALGIIVALFAARSLARPFEQIEVQNVRLEELKQAAETASEAKSNFLANMSHEMRTPLNAIIGLSELELGSDELSEETNNNIEKIYGSGMTLLGIINDILDISKIEAGKLELIPVEYDVPSLINDTVTLNSVRIGSKPIDFRMHIDENLPIKLWGDELRVKQIFNNLLSNAFKYTETGTVDWHLSCEADEKDVWITGIVTDTGIGIRQEDVPKLFSDYNQVDTKSNRRIEGTGLGLSITKKMLELMGGDIGVQSEYGKGSTFTVRFRQGAVDSGVIGKDTAENLADFRYFVRRRNKNERLVRAYIPYAAVLVVDDVPTNLDVAKGMMKPYGMTVDCVTSGPAAIALVRKGEPVYSAIFMDHMMPDMDGIEAARIIREEIGTDYARTIPIIALTANALVGNEELFLGHGFQAFLTKPIDIMRLDMVINDLVRNKRREKELNLTPRPVESGEKSREYRLLQEKKIPGLNIAKGLNRFNDNAQSYLTILRSYVNNTPDILEFLRDMSPDALSAYAVKVHGIKGSSYGISAEPLGKMAKELEDAANGGNYDFVKSHNGPFIELAQTLIRDLGELLGQIDAAVNKAVQPAPDPALLEVILKASRSYDIDALDRAIAKLEQYSYEAEGELVAWLRDQIGKSAFEEIEKRLAHGQG